MYDADLREKQPLFDVVINHFVGSADRGHLCASALFAVSLAVRQGHVGNVFLIDGSPQRDPHLQAEVERLGGTYHHAGRTLTFAEGYNAGAKLAQAEWLVLSASDVYPALDFFDKAAAFITATPTDRIGCIVPRLTLSDLSTQVSRLRPHSVFEIPLMTLNLNIFERRTFIAIGGVPEHFSGAYNDVEMAIKLRGLGKKIYLLPCRCTHFGNLTISLSGSNYKYERDLQAFMTRFPALADKHGYWALDVSQLSDGRLRWILALVTRLSPARSRCRNVERVMAMLPLLSRRMPL